MTQIRKEIKFFKCILSVIMLALIIAFLTPLTASASVRLNKTEVSVKQGKTTKLKIKGSKKPVKWSSSNKKIATVDKNGVVKGKTGGKAIIKAKVGKKTYKCNVTVLCKKHSYVTEITPPAKKNEFGRRSIVCKRCGYEKDFNYLFYVPTEEEAYADLMAQKSVYPQGQKQPGNGDIVSGYLEDLGRFTCSRLGLLLQEAVFGTVGTCKHLHNLYDVRVGDIIYDTYSDGDTKYRYAYTVISKDGNYINCVTARYGFFDWGCRLKITSPTTFIEPMEQSEENCPQNYLLEIYSLWYQNEDDQVTP
ncbi:Ig-like domain-containing protein [Butyrivibrio sp. WCD3002]|uniref:Ig-like domain-containing protein n=1 Tax=Butyrivibrio sp. WCD3002 TaxID=1280676 RepID=UPI00040733D1|nr:Ig-like domain-containing protein [Butyrivibrio sp. WCD3002]